jgi:hypothetical protein
MNNDKLNELIIEKIKVSNTIAQLQLVEDKYKSEIKYIMESEGLETYEDPNETLVTFKIQSRTSIDTPKIKELFGDKISEYMKTTSFSVLNVITKEEQERRSKRYSKSEVEQ